MAADAAQRGFDPDQHVLIRRPQDRTGCLRAHVGHPEVRTGADSGAGSSGRQHRHAVADSGSRVASRIVWIERVSPERTVVVGHVVRRPGHPVCQLGHHRLGDDDGARVAQKLRHGGIVGRDESLECQRAARRGHVRSVNVVLQRDRNSVQRPASPRLGALPVEAFGFRQRVRVHGDRRVQEVFVQGDPHQVLLYEIARGQAAFLHGRLQFRNRRLNDVVWLRYGRWPPLDFDFASDRRDEDRQDHATEGRARSVRRRKSRLQIRSHPRLPSLNFVAYNPTFASNEERNSGAISNIRFRDFLRRTLLDRIRLRLRRRHSVPSDDRIRARWNQGRPLAGARGPRPCCAATPP